MNSGKIITFKKGVLFDQNLNFNTTFHRCLKSYFMHSTLLILLKNLFRKISESTVLLTVSLSPHLCS